MSGVPCQKWSDSWPHAHAFTHVGDHNYCRNPDRSGLNHIWCYTNDTTLEWDFCPISYCQTSQNEESQPGSVVVPVRCLHKSTRGMDYRGTANTTFTGIPCQRWIDTWPNDHIWTHVGDHNYCRNPVGMDQPQNTPWCFANDIDFSRQPCSIPLCPTLTVFDLSLDHSRVSLEKENLPS